MKEIFILKTLLILCCLSFFGLRLVSTDPVQSPIRLRFNKQLFKKLINQHDQNIFVKAFQNVRIESGLDMVKLNHIDVVEYSLSPVGISQEEFDLDV